MANTSCGSVAVFSREESIRELDDAIQLQHAMVDWASQLNGKFADVKSKRIVSAEVTRLANLERKRESLKEASPWATTQRLVKTY